MKFDFVDITAGSKMLLVVFDRGTSKVLPGMYGCGGKRKGVLLEVAYKTDVHQTTIRLSRQDGGGSKQGSPPHGIKQGIRCLCTPFGRYVHSGSPSTIQHPP